MNCFFTHTGRNNTIRLVRANVPNEGCVEVFHNREWLRVSTNTWDINEADVACRQLGYAHAINAAGKQCYYSFGSCWETSFRCTGSENSLEECSNFPYPTSTLCSFNEAYSAVVCSENGEY